MKTFIRPFSFAIYMTLAVIVSFFPLYFRERGLSDAQIGFLYAAGPMVGIVSNLVWGVLSDRLQTVRNVLILLLAAQFALLWGIMFSGSFGMLLMLMTLFYFFQLAMTPLNDSLILLTVSGREGQTGYASYRVWGSIGFAAAALGFGELLRRIGIDRTVWLALATVLISLLLAFCLPDRRGTGKRMELGGAWRVVASRPLLLFLLPVLVLSLAARINDAFLALHMRELGASEAWVGRVWMISALSEIPVFFWLSKHGHRLHELPLLIVASLVYVVRFLLMGITEHPLGVFALQALHSCSFGVFMITSHRYLRLIVPDEYRATGQAVYAITWSGLAGLLAGSLGGQIVERAGTDTAYFVASGLALAAAAAFFVLHATGPAAGASMPERQEADRPPESRPVSGRSTGQDRSG